MNVRSFFHTFFSTIASSVFILIFALRAHAQDAQKDGDVATTSSGGMSVIEWIAVLAIVAVLVIFAGWWYRSRKYSTEGWGVHTVVQGETLITIAQHYATTWDMLATANDVKAPYILTVGQDLFVPVMQEVIDAAKEEDTQRGMEGFDDVTTANRVLGGVGTINHHSIHEDDPVLGSAQEFGDGDTDATDALEQSLALHAGNESTHSTRGMGDVTAVSDSMAVHSQPAAQPSAAQPESEQPESEQGAQSHEESVHGHTQEKPSVAALAREMQKKHVHNDDLIFAGRKKKIDVSWMKEDTADYDTSVDPVRQQRRVRMMQFIVWSLVVLGVVALALNILSRVRSGQAQKETRVSIVELSEADAQAKAAEEEKKRQAEEEQKKKEAEEEANADADIVREDVTTAVLNGGAPAGFAGRITTALGEASYKTQSAANAQNDYDETTIYYTDAQTQGAAQDVKQIMIDGDFITDATLVEDSTLTANSDADVLIVLGSDIEA